MKDENVNVKEIVKLYQEGKSQRVIAEEMGLSPKKVQKLISDLRNQGQDIKRGKFIDDRVIELYNQGKTQKEIGKKIGKTQKDVSLIIKRLKENKQLEEPEIKYEDIEKLRKEGKTMEQIGKEVGKSARTISKILRRVQKERIMKLYNEGKTIEQIIETLDNIDITYKCLRELKKEGKIKEEITELGKIKDEYINELRKQGKTMEQIGKEVGLSNETISKVLRRIQKERIMKLYNEGKTIEQIIETLGDINITYKSLNELKDECKIIERIPELEEVKNKKTKEKMHIDKKKEAKIIKLYKDGITIKEIEEQIGIIPNTVMRKLRNIELENNIIKLYKEGKSIEEILKITKARISRINQIIKRIKEEEKIILLLNEGKDKEKIAEELKISVHTVNYKIRDLKKCGILEERRNYNNRDIQIMKLYDEGNNYKQISEKMGKLNMTVLSEKIQKFRFQGLVGDKEIDKSNDEKVLNLYNEKKNNNEIAKELEMSPIIVSSILKRIKEERIISAKISQNPEIKAYFEKVESLIQVLKQQRIPTYEGIQSINVEIQKKAIHRKQNIEKTIHNLREYIKYIIDDDINKRVESKKFINMLYSNIIQKDNKQITI